MKCKFKFALSFYFTFLVTAYSQISFASEEMSSACERGTAAKSGSAAFFQHANYKGSCVIRLIGRYSNAQAIGIGNNKISSMKIGSNTQVSLCNDSNFRGRCRVYTKSMASLGKMNDKTSSVIVGKIKRPPPARTLPAKAQKNQLVPLKSYWSKERGDNSICGTNQCNQTHSSSRIYRYLRVEGCVFKTQVHGTIPLVLYWNPTRKDNVTVASNMSRQEQVNSGGYRSVRVEGYIYKQRQRGTIPLKLFWYPKRTDNATVAANESVAAQNNTPGMSYIRTEGYIYPASNCR